MILRWEYDLTVRIWSYGENMILRWEYDLKAEYDLTVRIFHGENMISRSEYDLTARIWSQGQNMISRREYDLKVRISHGENMISRSAYDLTVGIWSHGQNMISRSEYDLTVRIWSHGENMISSSEYDLTVRIWSQNQNMISRSEYPSNIYIFYFLSMSLIQSLIMALLGRICSSLVTTYCYRINILVFDHDFHHLILGTSVHELLKKTSTILMQTADFWRIFNGVLQTCQWTTEGGGAWGVQNPPPPRNSERSPKSCQTQPDCENS